MVWNSCQSNGISFPYINSKGDVTRCGFLFFCDFPNISILQAGGRQNHTTLNHLHSETPRRAASLSNQDQPNAAKAMPRTIVYRESIEERLP